MKILTGKNTKQSVMLNGYSSFMKACQASCEEMANLNLISLMSVALQCDAP